MKVASEKSSIWPEMTKVGTNISLEVCHEELAGKVVRKVVFVQVCPHHAEELPIGVVGLVRKQAHQASEVDPTKQSHQHKNLWKQIKLFGYE